jgi:hypothetical protein
MTCKYLPFETFLVSRSVCWVGRGKLGSLRAGGSSRAVSVAAILGLILVSLLTANVFDSSNLLNPTAPANGPPAPVRLPPEPPLNGTLGTLVISVTSNQNTTNFLAPPTNTSSDAQGVPVLVTFSEAIISSKAEYLWATNAYGLTGCIQCLPPGQYVVSIQYDGLNITVPADVFADNQTLVQASITSKLYRLVYSQESGVLVTPNVAQYTMFAKVSSSAPVANVSQPVHLNVLEGASAVKGYSVNATVLSEGAPTMGVQWLKLGTPSPVNLVGATSISMTTWTSSTTTTVGPISYAVGLLKP